MLKKSLKTIIIIFAVMLSAFLIMFICNFSNVTEKYAYNGIKNTLECKIAEIINYSAGSLKNFIQIEKSNGEIASISVNSSLLNVFASDVVCRVSQCLNNIKHEFSIPMGNFTNLIFLSGKGLGIPLTALCVGNVTGKVCSEFLSAGINQTLHRLKLVIRATMEILSPFDSNQIELNNEYILSETIIVGKIPEIYFIPEAIP